MSAGVPAERSGAVVIAGLGNEYRHDDGVGALVSRLAARAAGLRQAGPAVDPLDLLGRWDHARLAVVVDALRSGADPGTIRIAAVGPAGGGTDLGGLDDLGRLSHLAGTGSAGGARSARASGNHVRARTTSSHGVDVLGVLRLAHAVGQAPDRVLLVGIEGADFSPGVGLSPRVADAVPAAVDRIVSLLEEERPCA